MKKWISVEDNLPDDSKLKVVKYCRSDTGEHIGVSLSHFRKHWATGEFDFDFNRGTQPTEVSHWCDLPSE